MWRSGKNVCSIERSVHERVRLKEYTHMCAKDESESERWKWKQVGVIDES